MVEVSRWILEVLNPSVSTSTSLSRFSTQNRIGTPCMPTSGHPPSEYRNAPNPHITYTFCPVAPSTCGRQESFPSASDHPCLRTPPPPRFRPTRGHGQQYSPNPQVPPTPRHPAATANLAAASTQPGRTLFVAAVSPGGRTAHSTAVAITVHTPLRLHRSPPPTQTHDSPKYSPDTPSSMKTFEVPTTHTTSMEKPSIPENSRKSLMESVQTSLFQWFDADPICWLDTGPGSLFPSNPMSTRTSGEGPATLASKPSCPVPAPCIHTVGSRPSGTANRRAGKAHPSLHGPARSDVESLSAMSSHWKERTSFTAPTTAAGSLRPPASTGHPHPPVGRAPSPSPNPTGTPPCTMFPMARQAQGFRRMPTPCLAPVKTSLRKDSTVSILEAIPFPQTPCNGNREPSPRQAGLTSPYWLTARIRPFDLPNRAHFDSVSIRTANYQNNGILRFDEESPSEWSRRHLNSAPGVALNLPVASPQTGGDSGSWTRTGTDHP